MSYALSIAGLTLAFPFWIRADDLTASALAPANGAADVTDKIDPSPTTRIISVASNEDSGADWEITGAA